MTKDELFALNEKIVGFEPVEGVPHALYVYVSEPLTDAEYEHIRLNRPVGWNFIYRLELVGRRMLDAIGITRSHDG